MMKSKPNPYDTEKRKIYFLILQEIEKFGHFEEEQKLSIICKKLGMTKQNLNYYLKKFIRLGLINKTQSYPFAIYRPTEKGLRVKENLIQSERGVKTAMWRLHNIIVGFTIRRWGSWKFNDQKCVHMNNWFYQKIRRADNYVIHVQSTGLVKIYVPEKIGQDPELLRGMAFHEATETARWMIDHYDLELEPMRIIRKGQKELLNSQELAKLFGRIKTDGFYVDASNGEENLEEPDDSFRIENILEYIEQTPGRLDQVENGVHEFKSMLQGFMNQQVAAANAINYIGAAMKNQTEILSRLSDRMGGTQATGPSQEGERRSMGLPGPRKPQKTVLSNFVRPEKMEVEIIDNIPAFSYRDGGVERRVRPLPIGSRIFLPRAVSKTIIRDGYAKGVNS